ncbi:hypothetical protein [Dethiobacter alkaliphilus]|uniref:Uncharacterized protein n=1 Tax=Dethiobacter alkaliphilus AHT 1 TaxID=555088 RepID=C0GG28_DETAL|nr:hypothetical protein [Dethiobacter alkaliphilus]EEG77717.1 hypothetical protein DealDRAFT_1437 [Dethiobacter alkaliphilus AHT 1]
MLLMGRINGVTVLEKVSIKGHCESVVELAKKRELENNEGKGREKKRELVRN